MSMGMSVALQVLGSIVNQSIKEIKFWPDDEMLGNYYMYSLLSVWHYLSLQSI